MRTGEHVLAFRRRQETRQINAAGRTWEEQLAYDAVVQQVFFHRDLLQEMEPRGFPRREDYPPRRHISLREWEKIYAEAVPVEPSSDWIALSLRDADGAPAVGYPYRVRDSAGVVRRSRTDHRGEGILKALPNGPVEVTVGEPVDEPALNATRQAIRERLEAILRSEREESAKIEAEHQQRSLLGKVYAYEMARGRGAAPWALGSGLRPQGVERPGDPTSPPRPFRRLGYLALQ